MMLNTTTLEAAIAYATNGWAVFPVQPAPSKRPITANGFHDATTMPALIKEWWTAYPDAQIGVVCDGFVAIDLDENPQTFTSGRVSLETLGVDPETGSNLIMRTPTRRGLQLFFRGSASRRIGVLPGIDILGTGGYTIMPSPASPGREWISGDPFDPDDLEPLPGWATRLIGSHTAASMSARRARGVEVEETPLSDDEVAEIHSALHHIPNDDRGVWIKVGMALKSTGAGEQAYELWCDWSETSTKFNAKDQRYQWDRLHAMRIDGEEITLGTLFHMARERGWGQGVVDFELPSPSSDGVGTGEVDDSEDEDELGGGSLFCDICRHHHSVDADCIDGELLNAEEFRDAINKPEAREVLLKPPPDLIKLLDFSDVAQLPMVDWLIKGVLPERSVTLLAGDTMMGKSFVSIDMAMRLVHDMPFMGRKVRPCSVLYLAGEGQQGLCSRFRLWMQEHRGVRGDRYCLVSDRIPELNAKSIGTLRKMLEAIVANKGHAPGLVVVDTLSQALDGDENDASVTAPVLRALAMLREEFGCAIMVVHHIVKISRSFDADGNEKWVPLTLNQIRGSGAITRNVDTVLGLQTSRADREIYELVALKQKDGSMGRALRFRREIYQTDRVDVDGDPETSCIIQAAEDEAERREKDPEVIRAEREHEGIRKLVAVLEREGEMGARDSLVRAAGGKLTTMRSYLDLAIARKQILSIGTARCPRHVLPDHEDVPC